MCGYDRLCCSCISVGSGRVGQCAPRGLNSGEAGGHSCVHPRCPGTKEESRRCAGERIRSLPRLHVGRSRFRTDRGPSGHHGPGTDERDRLSALRGLFDRPRLDPGRRRRTRHHVVARAQSGGGSPMARRNTGSGWRTSMRSPKFWTICASAASWCCSGPITK